MRYFYLLFTLASCYLSNAQQKAYKIHTIAFYNLENLFDTIDNPNLLDEESPILKLKYKRSEVYHKKLKNLSKVISEIGFKKTNAPPTLLGVAEIENRGVLKNLIQTSNLKKYDYGIIHFDSPDLRGIDVGLLYRKNIFHPIHSQKFPLKIWSDKGLPIHTRDVLLVSGYLENELLHVLINHWPSRRGGVQHSSRFREKAAYLNKKICDSLRTEEPNSKILILGDFNDNPTDKSFKKIIQTSPIPNKANDSIFFNPFENLFIRGHNTLGYRDQLFLFDQILLSKSLLSTNNTFQSLGFYRARIYNPSYLTTPENKYHGYPFRSFSSAGFTNGYSDHYPVYVYLIKRNSTKE